MTPSTDYKTPPVSEAVIGVEFAPLPAGLVQLARAYSKWESDLPLAQDAPPLAPVIPAAAALMSDFTFDVTPGSLNTRFLFASEDQRYLLQLQNDRFLLNWRKLSDDDEYPRYNVLREKFEDLWSRFRAFVQSQGWPAPSIRSTEHSYFNHISGHPVIDHVLAGLTEPPQALPGEPLFVRLAEVRTLSASDYNAPGELSIACEPVPAGPPAAMQLAITVRFFTGDARAQGALNELLNRGHDVARSAFERIVSEDKQTEWGRV